MSFYKVYTSFPFYRSFNNPDQYLLQLGHEQLSFPSGYIVYEVIVFLSILNKVGHCSPNLLKRI